MLRILRRRVYGCLFGAQVVSLLGTGLATVALGLLAYDIAGQRASLVLGTLMTVKMVAYVVVAPLASAAVAGLPRRAVLVGSEAVRVGAALCLPFAAQIWQVLLLVFVLQAASATFTPAFQSVIPLVLPEQDEYTEALSLSRLAEDLESIASPMLAAALLLVIPGQTLFLGTAIGFAASALLVIGAALPTGVGMPAGQDGPVAPFGERARSGISRFVRTPSLRPVLVLNMTVAAAVALVLVQTVVIVRSVLGLPDSWVAVFLGINGAGSMGTALLLPKVLARVPERTVMLRAGVLLPLGAAAAGLVAGAGDVGWAPAALGALWFLIGVGWSAVETPMARIIRRSVDSDGLPAAFAAQFSLSHACWLISYPLAGILGQLGITACGLALAAIAAATLAAAAIIWNPGADGTEAQA
jgi:predicted MFS family arabinose efflux permease